MSKSISKTVVEAESTDELMTEVAAILRESGVPVETLDQYAYLGALKIIVEVLA